MYMAGVKPSATICEMMGDDGGSMPKAEVARYAEEHGIAMVDGAQVIEEWNRFLERTGLEV